MIKNQLYPYIEKYINSFLYGFTKEQLDVGILKGEIKLENLNLKPNGVNEVLNKDNLPFWLKAGLISKINLGCSLMNFIGEKPIEANFEDVHIILSPSYKWIIQNMDNFLVEDFNEMKMEYSPYDNNCVNIFGKKINVLDNSVFKKEKLEEFFKDKSKISNFLNKILIDCFQFYYSKSYALILKLKNIHIRFEDDQLINYFGNIALGFKIDSVELTLSSEGTMKKNNFKISKLDFYWENNAHILIPSNLLYDSILSGIESDSYYKTLSKIKFQNFVYKKDTKFILQNFNCFCNFGTKVIAQDKIDIFSKKEHNYKLYIQFACNEVKINFFPDLFAIKSNFSKFMKEFTVISQAQEFKPMKKPYNEKNRNFLEILNHIKKKQKSSLARKFPIKRKLITRDWLFYFYWCHKCKTSIYNYNLNPLRAEFTRYFSLYNKNETDRFNDYDNNNINKKKEELTEGDKPTWTRENPNPDKINLILNVDIKIKGINLNLHSSLLSKNINNEYIIIKITSPDFKFILNKEKCEFNFSVKTISLGPNKLKAGEKIIIINNNINKKQELNINNIESNNKRNKNYNNNLINHYLTENDIDSNIGITGFMKKYNPNYSKQLKVIDKAMEKINEVSKKNNQQSHNSSRIEINNTEETNNEEKEKMKLFNRNYNTHRENNTTNFSQNIIKRYEATPSLQKMELNRQKNEFNISQAINHYNNTKSQSKLNPSSEVNAHNNNTNNLNQEHHKVNIPKPDSINKINNAPKTSHAQKSKIISTGKILPLNLLEINSDNSENTNNISTNVPCFSLKYLKNNNNIGVDIVKIGIGYIKINLFIDYLLKFANILNDYKVSKVNFINRNNNKNNLFFSENDLLVDKNLYTMKKYILQKLEKMPVDKKNEQIKNYINYLKNEIEKGKLIYQSESSKINYIFNYFSKGIDIYFDYNNLECIYYNNKNNKFCGKAIIPSPQFIFKINHSSISLKLFEFEIDFNDLDNANILFKIMNTIIKDKLKYTQLLIEPCMQKLKKEMEEIDEELSTEEFINKKNDLKDNLNYVLNNNLKPTIINQTQNTELSLNINKVSEKNTTNNIKDINNKENAEKGPNLIHQNKKESKSALKNQNNINNKEIIDNDKNNNKIISEKNQMINMVNEISGPVDVKENGKKIEPKNNKKIVKREKKETIKSKTLDSINKNDSKPNINDSKIINNKEDEKENNDKKKISKKNSSNKLVEKRPENNIKTTKGLMPKKKKLNLAKKIPLKNVETKNIKNNQNNNNNN